MGKIPEPDDVDLFVGDIEIEQDANGSAATEEFIEEYKKRANYHVEVEEAQSILAALGINAREYGMPNAQSLLAHWNRCVAELHRSEPDDVSIGLVDPAGKSEHACASADISEETGH
jgi:hypothetical protein